MSPRGYSYTIILHPDPEEGGCMVTVPALPGCVSEGETIEEAIMMAKEAIGLHIEGLIAEGLPVPDGRSTPRRWSSASLHDRRRWPRTRGRGVRRRRWWSCGISAGRQADGTAWHMRKAGYLRALDEPTKQQIVEVLKRRGVVRASLFGSLAWGEGTKASDVDLLVELPEDASLLDLVAVKLDLEEARGRKVDVATYRSLHDLIRERVLQEQVAISMKASLLDMG